MSSPPDLSNCSSEALGSFLYESRFDRNPESTAQFLRAAADRVIANAIVCIEDSIDIGDALHDDVTISSIQPRGKLQISIGTHGVRMGLGEDVAGFMLRPNSIKTCVVFPKPEECRKPKSTASDIVVFVLTEQIAFKGKTHSQLCFQLPAKPKTNEDCSGITEDHTSKWMVLFQKSLNFGDYERVYHPKNQEYGNLNTFQSYSDQQVSSTTSGMPFINCYHTMNDGVVFPLSSVFVFYKPVRLFLLDVLSVKVQNTSSRYISITFEGPNGGQVEELTNISAHERTGLEHFLAEHHDVATIGENSPESSSDDPPPSSRSSRKRKAAVHASTINKRMVWQTQDEDEDEAEDQDVTFNMENDDDEDDDGTDDDQDDNRRSNDDEGETDEEEATSEASLVDEEEEEEE